MREGEGAVTELGLGSHVGARKVKKLPSVKFVIGMEGAIRAWKELRLGSPVGAREFCFFRCYLDG